MKRDIEFLFEIGSMANVPRGWRQHLAMDCMSNLEHSFRVALIALILARMEDLRGDEDGPAKNEEKILKMALFHDVSETRTSDLSYVQKVYVKPNEELAIFDIFAGTILTDMRTTIVKEYEERKTPEAQIVKDADNLDLDIELKELEERGSKLREKWAAIRRKVRDEKLYTQSARDLWDALQDADVSSWHLATNKLLKVPSAGK